MFMIIIITANKMSIVFVPCFCNLLVFDFSFEAKFMEEQS